MWLIWEVQFLFSQYSLIRNASILIGSLGEKYTWDFKIIVEEITYTTSKIVLNILALSCTLSIIIMIQCNLPGIVTLICSLISALPQCQDIWFLDYAFGMREVGWGFKLFYCVWGVVDVGFDGDEMK